jgi:hypothetical protein
MKKLRLAICLILCGVLWVGVPNSEAGDFVGKLCWQMSLEGKSYNLPFFVTQMAPGFYLLSGAPIATNDSYPLFQGAAQLRNNRLYVSISWTVTDGPQRETAQGEFDLSLSNLSGSGWFLWKTRWTNAGRTDEGYKEDVTLSFVACN